LFAKSGQIDIELITVGGAPASRIGSVSARCRGTSNPGIIEPLPVIISLASSDQCATGEGKERQEERRRSEGNRQAEHDLDQTAEPTGHIAKGKT